MATALPMAAAQPVTKLCTSTAVKAVGDRSFAFTISTEAQDREGDSILASGWQLDNYRRNPVVLWCHDHRRPPVGKALQIGIEAGALRATVNFTPPGMSAFNDQIHDMVAGNWIRGASVGFVPLEYTPRPGGGLTYTKAELIEFSLCPVPSNAGALAELRAKGLLDPGYVDADLLDRIEALDQEIMIERAVAAATAQAVQAMVKEALWRITGSLNYAP